MHDNKLKVIIFEKDQTIANMLSNLVTFFDHEALTYADPNICPLYTQEQCECSYDSTCADALLINADLPGLNSIEFMELLRTKGCKSPAKKIAFIGTEHPQKVAALELGCRFFEYPFRSRDIVDWLSECLLLKTSNLTDR